MTESWRGSSFVVPGSPFTGRQFAQFVKRGRPRVPKWEGGHGGKRRSWQLHRLGRANWTIPVPSWLHVQSARLQGRLRRGPRCNQPSLRTGRQHRVVFALPFPIVRLRWPVYSYPLSHGEAEAGAKSCRHCNATLGKSDGQGDWTLAGRFAVSNFPQSLFPSSPQAHHLL